MFVVSLVGNTSSFTTTTISQIIQTAQSAADYWSRYLDLRGQSIEIQLEITDLDSGVLAAAGPGDFVPLGPQDGFSNVLRAGTIHEILTGVDPNGSQPDIFVDISREVLQDNDYFLGDFSNDNVPFNQFDLFSTLVHEYAHGLGFFSFRTPDVPDNNSVATIDLLIQTAGSTGFQFIGENAQEVFGGPVPFSSGDPSHTAQFLNGILGPFISPGSRIPLSPLDIAIFQDLDIPIFEASQGNDTLSGFIAVDDNVELLGGNDSYEGLSGNDLVNGGSGSDTLNGDEGNDTLLGGMGQDILTGGAGNDSLDGGSNLDTIFGGAGNDTILGRSGADQIDAGEGNNLVDAAGGFDVITTGSGNDTIDSGIGADQINSGAGDDRIVTGTNLDSVNAGDGNDTVIAASGADTIDGGQGNDNISAGAGFDVITGGQGNDTIEGGIGRDTITGDDGNDVLNGGSNLDNIAGGAGDDTIAGGSGSDTIDGGTGADVITAGGGFDVVTAGAGNDRVTGGIGADNIDGGAGNDTIDGGTNLDVITGGAGNDLLTGGSGGDTFIFANNFGNDAITDFNPNAITPERIDLNQVSEITSFADLVANHLTDIGGNAVITAGANTITLNGVASTDLSADDFIF